ncbi:MAG: hypothetical protein QM680_13990 [Luteolibacter sp.]
MSNESKTAQPEVASGDLLARLPQTADGKPIFLGDIVFVENEDMAYFGPEAILELKVESLSVGTSFAEYKGTVTVCGEDLECGNLDCYADKETLCALLG